MRWLKLLVISAIYSYIGIVIIHGLLAFASGGVFSDDGGAIFLLKFFLFNPLVISLAALAYIPVAVVVWFFEFRKKNIFQPKTSKIHLFHLGGGIV